MILLTILGGILQVVGLAGCLLPWVAGPPLNFLGLLLLSIAKDWKVFSPGFLVLMGVLAALTMVLDYVLPLVGARRFGASKRGFWGALLGMIAGLLFFPPFGLLVGAFVGAVAAELTAGKNESEALKAGWGVFVGTMAALAAKLFVSGAMTYFYIKALF